MNKELQYKILREIVEVFRKNGINIESPYDIENFMTDYGTHEDFFLNGCFKELTDEE